MKIVSDLPEFVGGSVPLVLLLSVDRKLGNADRKAFHGVLLREERLDEDYKMVQLLRHVVDGSIRHWLPAHGHSWGGI